MTVSRQITIKALVLMVCLFTFTLATTAQEPTPPPRDHNLQAPVIELRGTRAPAGNFTVNTRADTPDVNELDGQCLDPNNLCSLRAAIMQANQLNPGSTITIPAGVYKLSRASVTEENNAFTGDLDINQSMTMIGAGAGATIIDGLNQDTVFEFPSGATVELRFMSVINGNAGDNSSTGGAMRIWNGSEVTLRGVTVANSKAGYGGGIEIISSTLHLIQSSVVNNTASNMGGGIDVFGTSTFTADSSTISNNIAGYNGAGIEALATSNLALSNMTIANNTAGTVGTGSGGGINTAADTTSITNTIIAGNAADNDDDCSGTFASDTTNFIGDKSGCLGTAGDTTGNPLLMPLSVTGPGLTPTHALASNSPAINIGSPACNPNTTDQRGINRVQGNACDIGAFEYTPQIVSNGDFETFIPESSTIPADWSLRNTTNKDKVKCNKPTKTFSVSEDCAFQFKADIAKKRAKLLQKPAFDALNSGDVIIMSGFVRGKNLSINAMKLIAVVKYSDTTRDKIKMSMPQGTYYYNHFIDNATIDAKPIDKVKVLIKYNSDSGKAFIDALDVVRETSTVALGSALPENYAGSGFTGQTVEESLPLPPAPLDN